MKDTGWYKYKEVVLFYDFPVTIVKSKCSSFADGSQIWSYQIEDFSGNRLMENDNPWIKETTLKKLHTPAGVTWDVLKDILKNDIIQRSDFE